MADRLTDAFLGFLNSCPVLQDPVIFGDGTQRDGLAMYPATGAAVVTEVEDVLGNVFQEGQYPAYIVYKTSTGSPATRVNVKEYLDGIGRWCEAQNTETIDIGDGYTVTGVSRQSNGYVDEINDNGVQTWAIMINFEYRHEFRR